MIQPGQILTTIAELREAKKMQDHGVVFQMRCPGGVMDWIPGTYRFNDVANSEYRRDPDPVIEIKPGQVIRTEDEFRRAREMQDQGVKFQYRCNNTLCCPDWKHGHEAFNGKIVFVAGSREQYRRAPETKTVPLEPKDVPPGSVIRFVRDDAKGYLGDGKDDWSLVLLVYPKGVVTMVHAAGSHSSQPGFDSFNDLRKHQIKRPGKDWEPCEKGVEVTE